MNRDLIKPLPTNLRAPHISRRLLLIAGISPLWLFPTTLLLNVGKQNLARRVSITGWDTRLDGMVLNIPLRRVLLVADLCELF